MGPQITKSSLGERIATESHGHKPHFSLGSRFQGGLSLVHTMLVVVSDGFRMFQAISGCFGVGG